MDYISNTILPTDFLFGTKVQPNKVQPITDMVTLTVKFKGQRSRSNFKKKDVLKLVIVTLTG